MTQEQEEQLFTTIQAIRTDLDILKQDVESMKKDTEDSNARFDKWDGRLWGLTLGLIGTSWTAIFAAAAVVITRTVLG